MPAPNFHRIEPITLCLIGGCYGGWLTALFLWPYAPLLSALILTLTIALQSSLQHEVLHGHPTPWQWLNEALVYPSLNLLIPYGRFRDTHLAHHYDPALTDPYEDPESNYLDPMVWAALPPWRRVALRLNNSLAGRMALGPLISQVSFMWSDVSQIAAGNKRILADWAVHGLLVVVVLLIVNASPAPVTGYFLCAYAGLSILKIRTFLEHRAHDLARARTVIVEDRGPLAFLFLNNNFHAVHHMHPQVPWYALPAMYRDGQARYLASNDGYVYRSYAQVFRAHFVKAKDPVPHPLWPQGFAPQTDKKAGQ